MSMPPRVRRSEERPRSFGDNQAVAKSRKEIRLGDSDPGAAAAPEEPSVRKVQEVPRSKEEATCSSAPDDEELVRHILMLRDRIERQGVDRERIARVILEPHVEPFISQELGDRIFGILFRFIVGVFLVTAFFASSECLGKCLESVMQFCVSLFPKRGA